MLTATYSMVVIEVERDKARGILHRLQKYLQTAWKGLQDIDFAFLDTLFSKLAQFDKYFRQRKIEVHLIPALRSASMEAQSLLDELDALNSRSEEALQIVASQLTSAMEMQCLQANEICNAMDLYCNSLIALLEKEEKELLPLAQRLLSIEEWFAIATRFLAEEGEATSGRRQSLSRARLADAVPGLN